MQPDDPLRIWWVGHIYALNGMPEEARKYNSRAFELANGDPNLELYNASLHALLGDETEARQILASVMAQGDSVFVSPASIAIVHSHLGEHEQAIDWLYRAVEEYDSFIFNLNYPDFDALRSNPRFIELCDKLRMPCADQWDNGNLE
jgi:tetratricopeptide (TPR) repeat protein